MLTRTEVKNQVIDKGSEVILWNECDCNYEDLGEERLETAVVLNVLHM